MSAIDPQHLLVIARRAIGLVDGNPFLLFALIGAVVYDFGARRSWPRLAGVVGTGAALVWLRSLGGMAYPGFFLGPFLLVGGYSGLVCLAASSAEFIVRRGRVSLEVRTAYLAGLGLVAFLMVVGQFLKVTTEFFPRTFDWYLYAFDERLGWNAPYHLGVWFDGSIWLRNASFLAYTGLPLLLALSGVLERGKVRYEYGGIWGVFLVAGIVGCLGYLALPACGPIYAAPEMFPYFNDSPLSRPDSLNLVPGMATIPFAARNCMPSLHFTWAILMFVEAWRRGWLQRSLFLAALILTGLATLGFGEHYLADLIVALPFSVLISALMRSSLSWTSVRRWTVIAVCLLEVAGWILFLRFGIQAVLSSGPALLWAASAATALSSLALRWYLVGQSGIPGWRSPGLPLAASANPPG